VNFHLEGDPTSGTDGQKHHVVADLDVRAQVVRLVLDGGPVEVVPLPRREEHKEGHPDGR